MLFCAPCCPARFQTKGLDTIFNNLSKIDLEGPNMETQSALEAPKFVQEQPKSVGTVRFDFTYGIVSHHDRLVGCQRMAVVGP